MWRYFIGTCMQLCPARPRAPSGRLGVSGVPRRYAGGFIEERVICIARGALPAPWPPAPFYKSCPDCGGARLQGMPRRGLCDGTSSRESPDASGREAPLAWRQVSTRANLDNP